MFGLIQQAHSPLFHAGQAMPLADGHHSRRYDRSPDCHALWKSLRFQRSHISAISFLCFFRIHFISLLSRRSVASMGGDHFGISEVKESGALCFGSGLHAMVVALPIGNQFLDRYRGGEVVVEHLASQLRKFAIACEP